jgi:uncharacterized protein YbaR (Trm112 family)
MPANSDSSVESSNFDQRLLEQLACPVCFGALQLLSQDQQIVCTECLRRYPLIDGIPVLIPERAVTPAVTS